MYNPIKIIPFGSFGFVNWVNKTSLFGFRFKKKLFKRWSKSKFLKILIFFKYGHASIGNGSGFNGCYASHIIIRPGTFVIKLPKSINDDLAATINCALATMVNCIDQIPDRIKRNKQSTILIQVRYSFKSYISILLS